MANITKTLVTEAADAEILDIAYKISGKLNLDSVYDDIYVGSKIIKFLRVVNDSNSLLNYSQEQQLLQSIIYLGNLTI